jgi:hypothetical protein
MTTYHPYDDEQERRTLRDAKNHVFALGLFVAALCALVAWVSFTHGSRLVQGDGPGTPSARTLSATDR